MVYEHNEDNDLNLLNLGHLVSKQLHVVNCLVSQVTLRAVVNYITKSSSWDIINIIVTFVLIIITLLNCHQHFHHFANLIISP